MIYKEDLQEFCEKSLEKGGMSKEDARIMADVLVTTDMWGVFTHGTKNLRGYIEKAKAGGVSFTNRPFFEKVLPSLAIMDGNNAMGYVSSVEAVDFACKQAEETGICMVAVKNSCHFGATGYYSYLAAKKGMIGIAATNVDKKMTIPGARGMVMGHNPFSLAAPAISIPAVILDTSSSNVASLKVLRAKAAGEKIPDTWITDGEGLPTTDPSGYPDEGALLPMGNFKGFGIAMFIEILTSVLLDKTTSTSDDVLSWCFDLDKPNNVCHSFIVVNPKLLGYDKSFEERVEAFVTDLHNAPLAKGCEKITVPGEDLWIKYNKAKNEGIELPDDVKNELISLSKENGIEIVFS